jgi:hypothetical protein
MILNKLKKIIPITITLTLLITGTIAFTLNTNSLDADAASDIPNQAGIQKVYISDNKEVKELPVINNQIVTVRIKITNSARKDLTVFDSLPKDSRANYQTFQTCLINLEEKLVCDSDNSLTRAWNLDKLLSPTGLVTNFNGYIEYKVFLSSNLDKDVNYNTEINANNQNITLSESANANLLYNEGSNLNKLKKKSKQLLCKEKFPRNYIKYIRCIRNS